jgi:FkbM family methyltransferase
MSIVQGFIGRFRSSDGDFRDNVSAAFSFLVNSLKFKTLNFNSRPNTIRISPGIKLNIHEKSYFPFRFFTDFDEVMVEEMQAFLRLTKTSRCFIDIGAHYGIFSLAFASRNNATAYAFEPSPSAYEMLHYNAQQNPNCRISTFPDAISSDNEKITLHLDVADHLVISKKNNGVSVEVNGIKLDDFVKEENIKPDVIKVDVEGYELEVLKGGKEVLSEYSPLIFLEIHPKELMENGQAVKQVTGFLSDLGYQFFDHNNSLVNSAILDRATRVSRVICRK